ncbi:aldehyde dehydrogenase family protein [Dehalobacter sp. DCM]|uniref:aldehyde dehydrogenase family protein n=1 Tax=Dehalobacter sp. DCM TaxID=2907827 RepID=UPI003081584B|nr:aldehyde dehydrogenase family protein [Dehalobacter sp. DCM]
MMNLSDQIKINAIIDNQEIPAKEYTEIRDPGKRSDIVGFVALGNKEDVDLAVQAAHRAFFSWRTVRVEERIERLLEAGELLKQSVTDLTYLMAREHGGLMREVKMDFMAGYSNFINYAQVVPAFLKPEQKEDVESWISIEKNPKGVVAAIVPWNMPVVLTMMKLVPALMTGNAIVVKPSPNAPLALTLLLKRMAAILPPGLINVVHGGDDVGKALTSHPLVRKVAFTGGCATGKEVNIRSAQSLKAVTLELGGNDPAIILEDANLEDMMPKILRAVFTRSGQVCYAIKRIYVQDTLFDAFIDDFCARVNQYIVGYGLDERSNIGPVNNERQYTFVQSLIEQARQSGAEVRELGIKLDPKNWENGYYILPHVVIDKEHCTDLVQCEQFGPVIPIIPFTTVDQAIALANDSDYGLAASIWSTDSEKAKTIAREMEAGLTFINTHGLGSTVFGMPFGGIKNSGIGREGSPLLTLSAYTDTHALRLLK